MGSEREEIPIANPGDYDRETLFEMWVGACSPLRVLVWADSFEDAWEEMVDYCDHPERAGVFSTVDDSDLRAAAEDLGLSWDEIKDDHSSEAFDRVVNAAQADMSMVGHTTLHHVTAPGMPCIPSWEWGGGEVDPGSDRYRDAFARSLKDGDHDLAEAWDQGIVASDFSSEAEARVGGRAFARGWCMGAGLRADEGGGLVDACERWTVDLYLQVRADEAAENRKGGE